MLPCDITCRGSGHDHPTQASQSQKNPNGPLQLGTLLGSRHSTHLSGTREDLLAQRELRIPVARALRRPAPTVRLQGQHKILDRSNGRDDPQGARVADRLDTRRCWFSQRAFVRKSRRRLAPRPRPPRRPIAASMQGLVAVAPVATTSHRREALSPVRATCHLLSQRGAYPGQTSFDFLVKSVPCRRSGVAHREEEVLDLTLRQPGCVPGTLQRPAAPLPSPP